MTNGKMAQKLVTLAAERYTREFDRYAKITEFMYEKCLRLIRDAGVQATVQRRTKSLKSFTEKLPRKHEKYNFSSEDEIFAKIGDLAAVRINVYMDKDLDAVYKAVRKFAGPPGSEKPIEDCKTGAYRATHFQVGISADEQEQDGPNWNLTGASCEIQVSTVLAHVFNEISHDIAYKPTLGKLNEIEKKLLESLGGVMVAGDSIIAALATAVDEHLQGRTGKFEDAHDFIVRMRNKFSSASRFSQYAAQLYDELEVLGIATPAAIEEQFLKQDQYEQYAQSVMYNASFYGRDAFWFEPDTSDVLLILVLEKHYEKVLENHPVGRGRGRPGRIATAARTYKEWVDDGKKERKPEEPGIYQI